MEPLKSHPLMILKAIQSAVLQPCGSSQRKTLAPNPLLIVRCDYFRMAHGGLHGPDQ